METLNVLTMNRAILSRTEEHLEPSQTSKRKRLAKICKGKFKRRFHCTKKLFSKDIFSKYDQTRSFMQLG